MMPILMLSQDQTTGPHLTSASIAFSCPPCMGTGHVLDAACLKWPLLGLYLIVCSCCHCLFKCMYISFSVHITQRGHPCRCLRALMRPLSLASREDWMISFSMLLAGRPIHVNRGFLMWLVDPPVRRVCVSLQPPLECFFFCLYLHAEKFPALASVLRDSLCVVFSSVCTLTFPLVGESEAAAVLRDTLSSGCIAIVYSPCGGAEPVLSFAQSSKADRQRVVVTPRYKEEFLLHVSFLSTSVSWCCGVNSAQTGRGKAAVVSLIRSRLRERARSNTC